MNNMVIDSAGNTGWYGADGFLHRLDGPAYVTEAGSWWFINGNRHRLDGPAIEWADGDKWWFINDVRYVTFNDFQAASGLSDMDIMILRLKYGSEL